MRSDVDIQTFGALGYLFFSYCLLMLFSQEQRDIDGGCGTAVS